MSIALRGSTSGSSVSGTSVTVTLPAGVAADDLLVLVVNRNTAGTYTFGPGVTASPIASNAGRLVAWRIIPDSPAVTSFTVAAASAFWSWWCAAISGADLAAPIESATGVSGNDATSALPMPVVPVSYIATGGEVAIFAAGVNATATWTGANTFATTSGNAALAVTTAALSAGGMSTPPTAVDRGNAGSARYESALGFVVQPLGNEPGVTLLSNGSFEAGPSIATGWEDESTTVGIPTYSLATGAGVTDGERAQRWQYTGRAGDGGGKAQFYQAPVTGAGPGQTVTFSVDVSGTMTNAYAIIGAEAFAPGGAYITDVSTSIRPQDVSATPTRFTVSYTVPEGSAYLAVFIQSPAFPASGVIDLTFDRATLTVSDPLPVHSGGSTAGVTVAADGGGLKRASGGSTAAVAVAAHGAGRQQPSRDITITLAGPTRHPLAVTGPARHPLAVTGPRS